METLTSSRDLSQAAREGDRRALFEALHTDIRERAERLARGLPAGHTLQATALVSEAYLRLVGTGERADPFVDKEHCLAAAAQAMRCVLIDHARAKQRAKRGGAWQRTSLDAVVLSYEERSVDLLALGEALEVLSEKDPLMAQAVDLRMFAGLGAEATAKALGMSPRTFDRHWSFAKAWLADALR